MDKQLSETISRFFATQPVLRAWVFGSYARGEQTPDSDIDLLVDFDYEHSTIGLFEFVEMSQKLSALIGKKVDLVANGTLLPFAVETAERDKKIIYERAS